jgi:hypothetical protein
VGGWRTKAVVPSTYDRRRRREEALRDEKPLHSRDELMGRGSAKNKKKHLHIGCIVQN